MCEIVGRFGLFARLFALIWSICDCGAYFEMRRCVLYWTSSIRKAPVLGKLFDSENAYGCLWYKHLVVFAIEMRACCRAQVSVNSFVDCTQKSRATRMYIVSLTLDLHFRMARYAHVPCFSTSQRCDVWKSRGRTQCTYAGCNEIAKDTCGILHRFLLSLKAPQNNSSHDVGSRQIHQSSMRAAQRSCECMVTCICQHTYMYLRHGSQKSCPDVMHVIMHNYVHTKHAHTYTNTYMYVYTCTHTYTAHTYMQQDAFSCHHDDAPCYMRHLDSIIPRPTMPLHRKSRKSHLADMSLGPRMHVCVCVCVCVSVSG
jgi:hypothetical protein